MRQNGSCFTGKRGTFQNASEMRQICIKNASKNARKTFGEEHLLDDTDKVPPPKRFWPPPHLWYDFPPPFVHAMSFSLEETGTARQIPLSEASKTGFGGALYSTFPPPPKIARYVSPPFAIAQEWRKSDRRVRKVTERWPKWKKKKWSNSFCRPPFAAPWKGAHSILLQSCGSLDPFLWSKGTIFYLETCTTVKGPFSTLKLAPPWRDLPEAPLEKDTAIHYDHRGKTKGNN